MSELYRVVEDDKNCTGKKEEEGGKKIKLSQQVIPWNNRFLLLKKLYGRKLYYCHIVMFLLYIHGWPYVERDEPFLIYSHLNSNWLHKAIFPSMARLSSRENPVRRQILIKHKFMPLFW